MKSTTLPFIKHYPYQIIFLSSRTPLVFVDLRTDKEANELDNETLQQLILDWMSEENIALCYLLLNKKKNEEWKESAPLIAYQELLEIHYPDIKKIRGCTWKKEISLEQTATILQQTTPISLENIASQQNAAILSPNKPFHPDMIKIPKPWGYEGWYTGIEKRGTSMVKDCCGLTELPYALSLFPQKTLGNHTDNLILLKTLNPVPDEVLGDLYLEMHEEKWEAYVVIGIDHQAWPTGKGIIKAGMNLEKLEEYKQNCGQNWEDTYLKDFHQSIRKYESVRRDIDLLLDKEKESLGFSPNDPVPPEQMKELLKKVSEDQKKQEYQLRKEAESFVGGCEVKEGDIVTFPTHQMHSLQHGVRVIEFQTPHYERLIVMFAQKVLTQGYWNTEKAMTLATPEVYHPPLPKVQENTPAIMNERFVDFPNFTADRITVQPEQHYKDQTGEQYHLLIIVTGQATLKWNNNQQTILKKEKAVLIPVSMGNYTVENSSSLPLIYLKAMPKNK